MIVGALTEASGEVGDAGILNDCGGCSCAFYTQCFAFRSLGVCDHFGRLVRLPDLAQHFAASLPTAEADVLFYSDAHWLLSAVNNSACTKGALSSFHGRLF